MVKEAVRTARAGGATGKILVRGDSAYGTSAVVAACIKAKVNFSVVLVKNPAVTAAIAGIDPDAWAPVHYPGAVVDPDAGELISDAQVAEVTFTAFASTKAHPWLGDVEIFVPQPERLTDPHTGVEQQGRTGTGHAGAHTHPGSLAPQPRSAPAAVPQRTAT